MTVCFSLKSIFVRGAEKFGRLSVKAFSGVVLTAFDLVRGRSSKFTPLSLLGRISSNSNSIKHRQLTLIAWSNERNLRNMKILLIGSGYYISYLLGRERQTSE